MESFGKSTKTVQETEVLAGKELAEMVCASHTADFYEKKSMQEQDMPNVAGIYVMNQLKDGEKSGKYIIKTSEEGKIAVYKNEDTELVSGKIEESGSIVW